MGKKFVLTVLLASFFSALLNASTGGGPEHKPNFQSQVKKAIPSNFLSTGASEKYFPFAAGDTIKTIPLPEDTINGIEWVRDTLYVIRQAVISDSSATLYKINPDDGTVYSQFKLPFVGYALDVVFDGNNLWIVTFYPYEIIYQITCSGTLIDSFASPILSTRGIAWDGQYLWIGGADNTALYKIDTFGAIVDSVYTGTLLSWAMGMTWVPEHTTGHLWVGDYTGNDINQFDVSGDTAILIKSFAHPATYLEDICHDGQNLWVSDFITPNLWQIDDGIDEGANIDTIRTIPTPTDSVMGIAWVNDTIYMLEQADDYTYNAELYKINPADGSTYSHFTLPFTGFVLGMTFDDNNLWIVTFYPNEIIYCVTRSGTLIDSFASPLGYGTRGIAWDGENLWIGGADNGFLYKIDTSGNVLDTIYTGNLISWGMDMVWVPQHTMGHLWFNDNDSNTVNQLDVSGDTAILIKKILHPGNYLEGVCHDGQDLWVSDYEIPKLWCLDDGIIEPAVEEIKPVLSSSLFQNYPNPFNRITSIKYCLPTNGMTELAIYDLQGRLVRTLINNPETAGNHTVNWDGKNDKGITVNNGIYFYQLKTNDTKEIKKILLLR